MVVCVVVRLVVAVHDFQAEDFTELLHCGLAVGGEADDVQDVTCLVHLFVYDESITDRSPGVQLCT